MAIVSSSSLAGRANVGVGGKALPAGEVKPVVKQAAPQQVIHKLTPMEKFAASGGRVGVVKEKMREVGALAEPEPIRKLSSFERAVAGSAVVGTTEKNKREVGAWQTKAADVSPQPPPSHNTEEKKSLQDKQDEINEKDVDDVFGELDEERASDPLTLLNNNPAQAGEISPAERKDPTPEPPPQAEIEDPPAIAPAPGEELIEFVTDVGVLKAKELMERIGTIAATLGGVPDPKFAQQTFRLDDPALSPVTLEAIVSGAFGINWHGWEPETMKVIYSELGKFLSPISQENVDKLHAYSVLKTSTYPWVDFQAFEKVAMALNGASPEFGHFEDLSPGMILYALGLMDHERPGLPLDEEVTTYIACKLFEHGCIFFPDNVFGEQINVMLQHLASGQISPEWYAKLVEAWEIFIMHGGLEQPPEVIDELSEDDWLDRQVLTAYLTARYALELQTNTQNQINQLAGWAQYSASN